MEITAHEQRHAHPFAAGVVVSRDRIENGIAHAVVEDEIRPVKGAFAPFVLLLFRNEMQPLFDERFRCLAAIKRGKGANLVRLHREPYVPEASGERR